LTPKKHIYFVSGTAANSKIFDRILLPPELYEFHFLEWMLPETKEETIEHYAIRMCKKVKHPNPILLGVSFGGVLVQEMSKIIPCEKIVLISSIKNKYELPKRLRFVKRTKAYIFFPSKSIDSIENFVQFIFGEKSKKRIDMYKDYLSIRDPLYLNWAIKQVLIWDQKYTLPNILHIHGDIDPIFPIKHIKDCTVVKKGSHVMIVTKAKKISRILLENLT
jgi:pimeloyl-ACP methyl ester carboxylesterase